MKVEICYCPLFKKTSKPNIKIFFSHEFFFFKFQLVLVVNTPAIFVKANKDNITLGINDLLLNKKFNLKKNKIINLKCTLKNKINKKNRNKKLESDEEEKDVENEVNKEEEVEEGVEEGTDEIDDEEEDLYDKNVDEEIKNQVEDDEKEECNYLLEKQHYGEDT